MTLTAKLRSLKASVIKAGLYKPARLAFDHVFNRDRVQNHKRRISLFRELISPGDLCFDVGANIGDYTAALKSAGARVVAIEPQPSCLRELRARFSGDKKVILVPFALGGTERVARFYIRQHHETSSLIENWESAESNDYLEKIDIPVKTLEGLFKAYGKPRYIKIDVEGSEMEILSALQSKIDLLSFEYHLTPSDYASKMKVIEMLERFGSLSFNLLPERATSFIWQQFVTFSEFRDEFHRRLNTPKEKFGDIFIKTR